MNLSNDIISITASEHGAELQSIVKDGKEYIWQADPAYWARRAPVLFPIVGRLWENCYRYMGKTYTMPQHGFARDMDFEIHRKTEQSLQFRLIDTPKTYEMYPFHFALTVTYTIKANTIKVQLRVDNTDEKMMYFQVGSHPGFYLPMFNSCIMERGNLLLYKSRGASYKAIDEVTISKLGPNGCLALEKKRQKLSKGLFQLNKTTFDQDALILENSQVQKVSILNLENKPVVSLRFGTPVLGIWSPAKKDAPFVCIEPWYGRCDSENYHGTFEEKKWMNRLSPNGHFTTSYMIDVE
jgi:Galactose mutarotase and related enzymes